MTTRGIRNNNPGNIEWGAPWKGLVAPENRTDKRFCQFVQPEWGIRAIAVILGNYAKRDVNTIREVVNTWAPAFENNVAAYVAHVCDVSGFGPDQVLDLHSHHDLEPVVRGIIEHENGEQPYDQRTLDHALSLAGVKP